MFTKLIAYLQSCSIRPIRCEVGFLHTVLERIKESRTLVRAMLIIPFERRYEVVDDDSYAAWYPVIKEKDV